MSESSFTSDSDSGSIILTPDGSDYDPNSSPETSMLLSSIVEVTAPSSPSSFGSRDSYGDDGSEDGSTDDDGGDAEAEWQESLQQLELLVSLVVVPFVGKWMGRKCAYIAWSRFMTWKYPV